MKHIRDAFTSLSPTESTLRRMAETIEKKKDEVCSPRTRFRRAISITAAAVLALAAVGGTAAAASPELVTVVRDFLTRRDALIAESGGVIAREVNAEGITLSVDGAVRDGDTTYLLCTLTNHEENFAGQFFTAEWITLARKPSGSDPLRNPHIRMDQGGIAGIYAGEMLKILSGDEGNTFSFILVYGTKLPEGEYSLTLEAPMLVTAEEDGTLTRTDLAEKLSVTFPLGHLMDMKSVYEVCPQKEFGLDGGGTVILESVRISPVEIVLTLSDRGAEYVPAPGYPDIMISPLDWLTTFSGLREMDVLTREQMSDIQDNIYHFHVTFRNNASTVDTANTFARHTVRKNADGYRTMTYTARLNVPISAEDIEKISLVRKPGNTDEIVLWTPQG